MANHQSQNINIDLDLDINNHQRKNSPPVPRARLVEPLPPLPKRASEAPLVLPQPSQPQTQASPSLRITTQIPYHDEPNSAEQTSEGEIHTDLVTGEESEDISLAALQTQLRSPPGYEPMYDYLRAQQLRRGRSSTVGTGFMQVPDYSVQSANLPPGYAACGSAMEPYHDEPSPREYVVNIHDSYSSGPIPHYSQQSTHSNAAPYSNASSPTGDDAPPSYSELYLRHELEMRRFEIEGEPAEQTEELVKWVVAMMLVCLTVAGVGTAFNWGRAS